MNINNLALQIAASLNAGTETWRVKTFSDDMDSWRVVLLGPDEQELFISTTWAGKGRIHIGGTWPNRVELQQISVPERPSITVSDTATPERVAKEITRRLLPEYQKVLSIVLAKQDSHDRYKAERAKAVQAVVNIVKGRKSTHDDYSVYTSGLTLEVSSPESINIKYCSVTLEQLEKIAKVVPELFNPSREA